MEVNRDYHRGEQPRQEVGGNSQDDSTLGVITIEEVDRGNQESEELEEGDPTQLDEIFFPQQLGQEGGGSITIDDSFMEDANRNYDSHSNIQDDSIDGLLNDTITIIDDPTVDSSQEERGW